jgi:glycosyltransferase involved in cell wall biosynthesis
LSQTNRIFPVSAYGAKYLSQKFSVPAHKITVSRLGLTIQPKTSPVNKNLLHLVSCSSVIPLKRIHLIVEILKHISENVHWTHFGDGPLLKEIKNQAAGLPSNCRVDLKGHVPNMDFLSYLENNSVSFFINVSESEGIPVSMMEAISFGIPLIGTAVCGVPEIATERTGFLIQKEFSPDEVARSITEQHELGKTYSAEFRNGIREFYLENFYAPKNHSLLAEQLAAV